VRLSILRHFQRTMFYIYAILCAGLTAYSLFTNNRLLLLVAWIPFLIYIVAGILGAVQGSWVKDSPVFLRTRYEFTPQGIAISTTQGHSQLEWAHVNEVQKMLNCYVLVLANASILAIPESAVPPHQKDLFEQLLRDHIAKKS
ncbi:MAG: YcxB family protein, partial [Chloroflexales bacterium]|nr:YcxB family protein [Chloroflexales bacterium]